MKTKRQQEKEQELLDKIAEVCSDLRDIALEIADDLQFADDLGDNISCFLDKQLYEEFQSIDAEHTKLWGKLNKLREKFK